MQIGLPGSTDLDLALIRHGIALELPGDLRLGQNVRGLKSKRKRAMINPRKDFNHAVARCLDRLPG
jgi:hypothetical protein